MNRPKLKILENRFFTRSQKLTTLSLLKFSIPLALGQLAQMMIGFGDDIIAAHHSSEAVAAIGVSVGISNPFFVMGLGLIWAISPVLSRKQGEGEDISSHLKTALLHSFFLGVVITILGQLLRLTIPYFDFAPGVGELAHQFLDIYSWSFFWSYLATGVQDFLQANRIIIFPNVLTVFLVLLNLALGISLCFGLNWKGLPFTIPPMGIRGIAYSSVVVRFIAAISLISYAFYRFPPKNFPLAKAFNWPLIASFWKLSLPHSMAIFLEVTAFGITAPMLAHISALEAAAHNLALLLASTSFMIPMAIANATSVKIAHRMGQGNTQGVINLARSGLILTTSFMVFSALCYWLLGNSVTSLITNDPELRAKMIPILVVMGIFQIADGIQVTQSGIQRGMGHTRKAFLISVFAYWMIAIPIGLYFAFRQNMGAFGMWIGLAIALYIAASLLTLLTRHYLKNLNQKEMLPRINWKEKVSV